MWKNLKLAPFGSVPHFFLFWEKREVWRGPAYPLRIEKDLHQKTPFHYFSSIDNLLGVWDVFGERLRLEVFFD